jgi:hypothetical protein
MSSLVKTFATTTRFTTLAEVLQQTWHRLLVLFAGLAQRLRQPQHTEKEALVYAYRRSQYERTVDELRDRVLRSGPGNILW